MQMRPRANTANLPGVGVGAESGKAGHMRPEGGTINQVGMDADRLETDGMG